MIGCFSDINTGKGGAYYSLLHTQRFLSVKSKIVVIGDFVPEVFSKNPEVIFLQCSRLRLLTAKSYLTYKQEMPDIIHCFDLSVAPYAASICRKNNIKLVVTKPGGPATRHWFLPYKNHIFFHSEDFERYNKRLLRPTKIALIPHRVVSPDHPKKRPNPFKSKNLNGIKKLICISRIGKYYEHKLCQAINLLIELENRGIRCELVIIGVVEDTDTLNHLKKISEPYRVTIRNDTASTLNAAEFIHYADIVVAGGRSLMEAISLGKPSFFPVKNSKLPCFADSKTIKEAAYFNFSERVNLSAVISPFEGINKYLLINEFGLKRYSIWAKEFFVEHFSAETGAVRHQEFYANSVSLECIVTIKWNMLSVYLSSIRHSVKKFLSQL